MSDKLSQSEVWPRFDRKWSILSRGYCCIINKAKPAVPISHIKAPHASVVVFTDHSVNVFALHTYICVRVSAGEEAIGFLNGGLSGSSVSCFHTSLPPSLSLSPALCVFSPQSSELDDILNDLQNAQPQLFCEPRPVSLPSPMDKQNIINDILQMSETNPAMAAQQQQQQHRGIGTGMGPTSESHTDSEGHDVQKIVPT